MKSVTHLPYAWFCTCVRDDDQWECPHCGRITKELAGARITR